MAIIDLDVRLVPVCPYKEMVYLDHGITLNIILEAFQLQVEYWRE